jgi:(p)ppGpp synthase/HD superfamily hydrolase
MGKLYENALIFAITRHDLFAKAPKNRVRKYTGEPYVVHPIEVAGILREHGVYDENVLAAALCHDLLEDTNTSYFELSEKTNPDVARLVAEVTQPSKSSDGNRAVRKQKDLEHYAEASPDGMSIKVADLISNSRTIIVHDPKFAKVYMAEKEALLKVLFNAHPSLLDHANRIVEAYKMDVKFTETFV